MRKPVVLIAVGLALAGCRVPEKERAPRADEDGGAGTASRTRPAPKGWLDGPTPNLGLVDTPPADSWTDPRDRGFDVTREVRGVLAGFVEDPDGRKLRDVFIEVEPADPSPSSGAPVGVQTDRHGYFLIKGLKPRQAYVLTAQTTHDGRALGGRAYAQTSTERSQFIRLSLLDGLSFPNAGHGSPDRPAASQVPANPPNLTIPSPVLPPTDPSSLPEPVRRGDDGQTPTRPADAGDGAFSPVGPRTQSPAPPPADTRPPVPPLRKDLVTEGPAGIWRPPTTSIPTMPSPTPGQSQSKSIAPNAEFVLIDASGYRREFPSGRNGELVLLDFMTTTCLPCKKAIPALNAIHARYGLRGVEVVGVACDTVGVAERRRLSAEYKSKYGVSYLLYVEPGEEPGPLARRFEVTGYPTLVLLDGSGRVRWTGHPNDLPELERVIATELSAARR